MSPALTEPVLQVETVSKQFGGLTVVREVSFELRKGEFLTMLGPSGSGKTTTLNMIAGFLQPDAGRIRLASRDVTALPAHRRGIGMVFQNYALFPHMSALTNVAFPLEMRGVSRREALRRAHAALELVELDQVGHRLPKQLSGGQQQRVALARAFVFEPDLLLMDEPLGALDKRLRETMQLEIMRISRTLGVTVVYVTHDQEEALVMSDRIAIYNDGRIEQLGTAEELYERPASIFVASFVGQSNLLPATLDQDGMVLGEGWTATAPNSDAPLPAGSCVTLVVRPDAITIGRDHSADPSPCSITGVVQDVIYMGSIRKYLVDAAGVGVVEARIPRTAGASAIARGERVRLRWHPQDSVIIAG